MERLTKPSRHGDRYVSAIGSGAGCWGAIVNRLAAYEDTGLEPEDIKEICSDDVVELARMLRKMIETGEADRLVELEAADQEGRLVVLPCKQKDPNRYLIYLCRSDPYGGGIDAVINDIENGTSKNTARFPSLEAVFQAVAETRCCKVKDVVLEYYGYDRRIHKNVYIVLVKKSGGQDCIKKYGCPQAAVYLVDLDEEEPQETKDRKWWE